MRTSINWILITLFLNMAMAAAPPGAAGHPSHVTIAEAEYNPESGKLEIALRVDQPGDLEKALSSRTGNKIDLENSKNIDKIITEYLQKTFQVQHSDGRLAKLEWVGKEVTIKTAWLYFEVVLPDGLEGVEITHRMLFEVEADQANTLTIGRGADRISLRFTREAPTKVVRLPAFETKGQ